MGNLNLYLLKLTSPDELLLNKTIPKLPQILQNKIYHFHFLADKWRTLLSHLFMCTILAQELQINPDRMAILYDEYGKPFLKNHPRHFNLSHAKDFVVLVTSHAPVGIDIESIEPLDNLEELISTCFSQEEQLSFSSKQNQERLEHFYELWTLKESYLKAIGRGLSYPLNSFSITSSPQGWILKSPLEKTELWHFKSYTFAKGYKGALCAQSPLFPENPTTVLASAIISHGTNTHFKVI